MNVMDMAGYMREAYMWQLLRDVAREVTDGKAVSGITPYYIIWDDGHFTLAVTDGTTEAVPETDLVWQLAATAFHLFMGCPVFSGKGQQGQHADSPLPYMRKSMPELSGLVCQMLSYDKHLRPSMADVGKAAEANLARLKATPPLRPKKTERRDGMDHINDFWPDEFEPSNGNW